MPPSRMGWMIRSFRRCIHLSGLALQMLGIVQNTWHTWYTCFIWYFEYLRVIWHYLFQICSWPPGEGALPASLRALWERRPHRQDSRWLSSTWKLGLERKTTWQSPSLLKTPVPFLETHWRNILRAYLGVRNMIHQQSSTLCRISLLTCHTRNFCALHYACNWCIYPAQWA